MHHGARRKATVGLSSRLSRLTPAVERALAAGRVRPVLEGLEQRQLLANTVIINEFLADNATGLKLSDNSHPDWIELYNPTGSAQNMSNWKIKDGNTVWPFPSTTTIQPGAYLVVVADNLPGGDPAYLHTNFKIGKGGEYLGLIKPDGTVANEFAPFPAQTTDVSYGILSQSTTLPLFGPTAPLKVAIPSSNAFDTPTPNWRNETFDDSGAAWLSGTGGVGFDSNPAGPAGQPGWMVKMYQAASGSFNSSAIAKTVLDGNTAGFTPAYNQTVGPVSVIDYVDGGHFGTGATLPNGGSVAGGDATALRTQYALRATAYVTIPAGTYTVGVNSDDGFQLTIPGVTFTNRLGEENSLATSSPSQLTYSAPRGASDTTGTFTLNAPLTTTITVDMFEQAGGDGFEVFIGPGTKTSVDGSFALLANGVQGWGLTTTPPNTPLAGQFGKDVQAQMLNVNASAYVRIPFNVNAEDLPAYQSLLLNMKYDDGFVAWLNGVQVASANAPASPAFNSAATASNPNTLAVQFQKFILGNPQALLHAGLNVLTIQALNASAADSDFLNLATLDAVTSTVDVTRFFSPATPGTANTGGLIGQVKDTKFDHDRGFYSADFFLGITSPDTANGAVIRYTTNGSEPTATSGTVYTGPIEIKGTTVVRAAAFRNGYLPTDIDTQSYIFLRDVISQSASQTNNGTPPPGWPTSFTPNTTDYGMDPRVTNANLGTFKNDMQSIPTISIVSDLNNIFGPTGFYSNSNSSGIATERPGSVELINPDGSTGFQVNAGLRVRGGYSRSSGNPKHALRVLLRDSYGTGTLDYPLFKSMDGADTTRGFDLRTFENYSWSFDPSGSPGFGIPNTGAGSRFIGLRDQFSRDAQHDLGHNAERGDFYHLYIDGQYWGIYNTAERPEADNAVTYYGGSTDDYDTIKVDPQLGYTINATDGNRTGWNAFYDLATQIRTAADAGQSTQALFQKIQGKNPDGTRNPNFPVYLDQDNLIDYMLVIYYGGNEDAPISNFLGNTSPNNFYAIWNHTTKNMGWQFFSHDAEHTLLDATAPGSNRLGDAGGPFTAGQGNVDKSNPQWIFQQLMYDKDFRTRVGDRIHRAFFNDGALTTAANKARLIKRRDEINRAIVGESARWGDAKSGTPFTYQTWQQNINIVLNQFIANRNTQLIPQGAGGDFRTFQMGDNVAGNSFNMYPTVNAPEFTEQFGGPIGANFVLHMTNPDNVGTIYYTLDGSDPRAGGLANGAVSGTALAYNPAAGIPLNASTRVRARVLNGTVWSAVTDAVFTTATPAPLRITEIMYHPADPPAGTVYVDEDFEYVEVQNVSGQPLNLKNYALTNGVEFTFPDMTLAAGARTLVVSNLAAFQSRYGAALPVAGTYVGHLDNGGETVTLSGALGEVVQTFKYNDKWYPQTDGEGFSMVAADPNQATSLYDRSLGWRASKAVGGDPATNVPALASGTVVVNELSAKVVTANTTWIELRNTTNAPVDLSGWFLSNAGSDLKKYKFPAGTVIAANGFLLLNEQTSYGQAGNSAATTPFTLDGNGADTVYLSQADATGTLMGYREIQGYGAADAGQTLGRLVKSDGDVDFVIQKTPTPGAANGSPLIGPMVINEIMYGPITNFSATLPNTGGTGTVQFPNPNLEYIELRNVTNADLFLYDQANPTNAWRLTGGADFTFPTADLTKLKVPAFGYVILTNLAPADFQSAYSAAYGVPVPASAQIFGPVSGFLDNAGEKISIQRPGTPGVGGVVPYITVDSVTYDRTGAWVSQPDQTGPSLVRKAPLLYGNDPTDWTFSSQFGGSPAGLNVPLAAPTAVVPAATIAKNTNFVVGGGINYNDLGGTWVIHSVDWGDGSPTSSAWTFNANDTTFTFPAHQYANAGQYNVTIRLLNSKGGNQGITTVPVNVVSDVTPPTVAAGQFLYSGGAKQRVSVQFSENVQASLQAGDLKIYNRNTQAAVPAADVTLSGYDVNTNTATWTVNNMADAYFTATLGAADVADPTGNTMAQDYVLGFYFMGADATRDKTVDFNDLVPLAQNYNTTLDPAHPELWWAQGDFTADGMVDFNDLVPLAQRYNTTLTNPAAGAVPAPLPGGNTFSQDFATAQAMAAAVKPTPVPPTPTKPPVVAKPPVVVKPPVKAPPKPVVTSKPVAKPVAKPVVKAAAPTPAVVAAPAGVFSTTRVSTTTDKKKNDLLA